MTTDAKERRRKRRVMRLVQQESVWLQKALFALKKAEATREKIHDTRDEDHDEDYVIEAEDTTLPLPELEEVLEGQIERLLKQSKEMRRNLMG